MRGLMKYKWTIGDLIDLEYVLGQDDGHTEADMAQRDRRIFLETVLPDMEKKGRNQPVNRRNALLLWLNARREEPVRPDMMSPGDIYHELFRLLLSAAFLMAAGTGVGLALAFLQYQGGEPVNVSAYLGVFVLFQLFLLFLLLLFSLLRKWLGLLRQYSLTRLFLGTILSGAYRRLITRSAGRLPAARRHQLKALSGFVRGRNRIYGSVFYWPLFILAQTIGIGFNLGVLAGSVFKIIGADLAFGWQSTIQLSSRAVYELVEVIACPWSWLLPAATAHPTLSQVEGSRMVLKEGMYHLSTPDLVAWWPFLLLAVIFYGLLPRLLLLAAGMAAQSKTIRGIAFTHSSCERLMRRMTTPVVETGGDTSNPAAGKAGDAEKQPSVNGKTALFADDAEAIVIVPEDIASQFKHGAMAQALQTTLNMRPTQTVPVTFDAGEDSQALVTMGDALSEREARHIVVLQESWQPPIEETISYFQQMRSLLPRETHIHILLFGRKQHGNYFSPVDPLEERTWQQAIQSLGDPHTEVRPIRILP